MTAPITAASFAALAGMLKTRSGLIIGPDKVYLLETRLTSFMRREKLVDLNAVAERLARPGAEPLLREVVEAMTTNESFFFRDDKPFDDSVVGHYVYRVAWTADGGELTFLRMNRRQNVMEVAAANPTTGACRVVLREEWPSGWLMSEPRMVFLADGKRFIWESQRNGWDNFYLYDLSGRLIAPITSSTTFEAAALVKIDERAKILFYTARDGALRWLAKRRGIVVPSLLADVRVDKADDAVLQAAASSTSSTSLSNGHAAAEPALTAKGGH